MPSGKACLVPVAATSSDYSHPVVVPDLGTLEGPRMPTAFSGECFQPHKINHYNNVLRRYERAIPQLILIAKVTPTRGNFARPNANGHKDVEELEDFLIGIAYAKNHELANIHGTKFLQNAVIPGVLNSPTGNPGKSASTLKALLGL